jgi:hypothetical protein
MAIDFTPDFDFEEEGSQDPFSLIPTPGGEKRTSITANRKVTPKEDTSSFASQAAILKRDRVWLTSPMLLVQRRGKTMQTM